jgi:hypothetical protein
MHTYLFYYLASIGVGGSKVCISTVYICKYKHRYIYLCMHIYIYIQLFGYYYLAGIGVRGGGQGYDNDDVYSPLIATHELNKITLRTKYV